MFYVYIICSTCYVSVTVGIPTGHTGLRTYRLHAKVDGPQDGPPSRPRAGEALTRLFHTRLAAAQIVLPVRARGEVYCA